ncbi:hypothetical protein V8C35DRAFT_309017 [Trichoderma chlorosporum]
MDGTTTPGWGSGYEPVVSNSFPASFVTFFPAPEAKTEISWADKLVAQRPAAIARAWSRVPVAAGPSTLRKGMTIMKRVGSANSRAVKSQTAAASQVATENEVSPEDLEETQRASRRRLDSFVPAAEDVVLELVGEPLSMAEMASAIMRAKVDVANCYLQAEYADASDQRSLAKQGQYSKKILPMKRRFNDHSSINFEYASGGNGAAIYRELRPIIFKAMQTGATEIDVHTASIAEAGAHLRSMHRNPRVSLAASGMPELSDIADDSEPSSILTLEPNESMSDAKSPTKRDSTQSPSPTKSNKSFRKRLSDTIVRLLPGSSPRAEPSPIKHSPPPTPSKDSKSPRDRTPSISIPKSPSGSRSPLLSANSTPGLVRWSSKPSKESPFARWRPKRKSEPVRLFTTPSPQRNDSSFTLDDTMEEGSTILESPAHQSRPDAPTPSKWNGLQSSSSPSQKRSSAAATPTNDRASLNLVKSLPEWMRHSQSPATLEKHNLTDLDFQPSSPSFANSVSWVNTPADAIESERTRIVRRRKSEPLSRNVLKSQSLRRMSLSPQKSIRTDGTNEAIPTVGGFVFSQEDVVSQIPEHSQSPTLFNPPAAQSDTPNNAVTEPTEDMDFDRLSWNYKADIEDILREQRNAPLPPAGHPDDVFNDPNDRYRRPSPPPRDPIKRLARMAENGCYEKANVFIGRKEERLLVQFKLPIKYMYLFPKNQEEEPRLSTGSPSEPQSPIVRFYREAPAPEETPEPPSPQPRQRSEWDSSPFEDEEVHAVDQTLVVSDFAGSPAKRISLSVENDESRLLDETLIVSDFGSPVKRPLSPEHEEFHPGDETLIVSDFCSSPTKRSPPTSTLQKVPYTPADQFIIPDYLDTSERKAYNPAANLAYPVFSEPVANSEPVASPELPVDSDSSPLSDLENTPPLNPSSELSIINMATANEGEQSASTHTQPSPTDSTIANAPLSTSPISFTPVNQGSAQNKSPASIKQDPPTSPGSGKQHPISHDDSPERDFLRDFIRRSRPRRRSTTETGSPVAPPQRLPLGARSPNMETLPKEKRKFESSEGEEGNENEPAAKQEPAAKRARKMPRATPPKPQSIAISNDEETLAKDATETLVKSSDNTDEPASTEEQKEDSIAAVSRRSSRLKAKPSAIPKSSIPAPTKVGRGRPPSLPLGSARNEQQDLVHQTRANTRRNKGNAEYPAQVLARHSEEEDGDSSQQDEGEASKTLRGKSVIWKEPLASYQQEEKPKRGRPSAAAKEAKAKAKSAGNRVSKPAPKPSAATQKQRSSRIAAGLGMAGNGTPAPKRATRASTRTRK